MTPTAEYAPALAASVLAELAARDTALAAETVRADAALAALDQRAAYAAGLEAQLSESQAAAAALAAQVAALRADLAARPPAPAPGMVVTRAEMTRRIYPLMIALAKAAGPEGQAIRDKWATLLAPLQAFDVVHLDDPIIADLAALAVADKLLSADEARKAVAP